MPLAAYSLESLSNVIESQGFARYRAAQVLEWLYKKCARSFAEMKNIGAPLQKHLEARCIVSSSTLVAAHDAGDGAVKLQILLEDGETIEAVVIEAGDRVTLCVSSQAGCPLGCAFCATGAGGFARSLCPHEIIEQALHARTVLEEGRRISHVVFMGMGEPCLNLDAVFDSARTLNAEYAFGIGARRITISTIGFPECIEAIAEFPMEVGLAVSLHAADDEKRRRLLPRAPCSAREVVEAASEYFRRTGREVTYEYVLLGGVNDSTADAEALARLLAGRQAFVNLIPFNEAEGLEFRRPAARKVSGFRRSLKARGINAEVRASRGGGARAACGQLRLACKREAGA
jgi:23S rRNA (adenine2503-C2)-methyltransferase